MHPDEQPQHTDDYDADDDLGKSLLFCYEEIRKRMAEGKEGWEPKC